MWYEYPVWLEVESNDGFREAMTRYRAFSSLVSFMKNLWQEEFDTWSVYEQVKPLYIAAHEETGRWIRDAGRGESQKQADYVRSTFMADVWMRVIRPFKEAKRYIIVPFDSGTKEFDTFADKWVAYSRSKQDGRYESLTWRGKSVPLKDIHLASQIYILGHCHAGSQTLSSSDDGTGMKVRFDTLAHLLSRLGLSKDYYGRIKIYACQGGADDTSKPNGTAFSTRFATSMKSSGYQFCEIFGYNVNLAASSTFMDLDGRYNSIADLTKHIDSNWLLQAAMKEISDGGSLADINVKMTEIFKREMSRAKELAGKPKSQRIRE